MKAGKGGPSLLNFLWGKRLADKPKPPANKPKRRAKKPVAATPVDSIELRHLDEVVAAQVRAFFAGEMPDFTKDGGRAVQIPHPLKEGVNIEIKGAGLYGRGIQFGTRRKTGPKATLFDFDGRILAALSGTPASPLDSVTERGAGGVGLNVRGNDETVLSATPALELGVQFGSPGGTLVRPYVRGGATFFDDPDFGLLASFQGAPGGIGPFRIATETDDVVGDVSAGVDVIATNGSSFSFYYDGRFGDTVEAHEGGVKGTIPF